MTIDQDKLTKLSYDPASERFSLTDEQAYALADPDGLSLPGAFMLALGALRTESQVTDAFRTGAGIGWREHHPDVFTGCDAARKRAADAGVADRVASRSRPRSTPSMRRP